MEHAKGRASYGTQFPERMAVKTSRSFYLLAFLLFEAARALQSGGGGGPAGFPAQHHPGGHGTGQQPQQQQQQRQDQQQVSIRVSSWLGLGAQNVSRAKALHL